MRTIISHDASHFSSGYTTFYSFDECSIAACIFSVNNGPGYWNACIHDRSRLSLIWMGPYGIHPKSYVNDLNLAVHNVQIWNFITIIPHTIFELIRNHNSDKLKSVGVCLVCWVNAYNFLAKLLEHLSLESRHNNKQKAVFIKILIGVINCPLRITVSCEKDSNRQSWIYHTCDL